MSFVVKFGKEFGWVEEINFVVEDFFFFRFNVGYGSIN